MATPHDQQRYLDVTHPRPLCICICIFICISVSSLAILQYSQKAYGAGNLRRVGDLFQRQMAMHVLMVCVPVVVIWLNAEHLLVACGQPREISAMAALFLKWRIWGLPFNCLQINLDAILQCSQVRTEYVCVSVSLYFGIFTHPKVTLDTHTCTCVQCQSHGIWSVSVPSKSCVGLDGACCCCVGLQLEFEFETQNRIVKTRTNLLAPLSSSQCSQKKRRLSFTLWSSGLVWFGDGVCRHASPRG